jgi:integrase
VRHTFITRCRDAGVPVHEIAAITGHHLEGTIDRFYVNPATIGASALQSIAPVFADLVPEGV